MSALDRPTGYRNDGRTSDWPSKQATYGSVIKARLPGTPRIVKHSEDSNGLAAVLRAGAVRCARNGRDRGPLARVVILRRELGGGPARRAHSPSRHPSAGCLSAVAEAPIVHSCEVS